MAITQVEYLESTIAEPHAVRSAGNFIYSVQRFDGTSSASTISIYNTETKKSYRFAGVTTPTKIMASHGTDVYFVLYNYASAYQYIYKYTSSGDMLMVANCPPYLVYLPNSERLLYFSGKILSESFVYDISSGGYISLNSSNYFGTDGTTLWRTKDGNKIVEYDYVNKTDVGSETTVSPNIISTIGTLCGEYIYWPTWNGGACLTGINTTTGAPKSVVATPNGFPFPPNDSGVEYKYNPSDGYLYRLKSNTELVILDPETGRWKIETLAPTRTNRYGLAIGSNGKIYIPSGKPDTWV